MIKRFPPVAVFELRITRSAEQRLIHWAATWVRSSTKVLSINHIADGDPSLISSTCV